MSGALPEGNAIVYCQGMFGTTNGKTAHGLVRRTRRYRILSVVDRRHAGSDAGAVLDGRPAGIPVYASVREAVRVAREGGATPTHLVIGLAPDGGRLPVSNRQEVMEAIRLGLSIDSGLHDYLSEDAEMRALARDHGVRLRDVRRPPERRDLHFFSGKIEQVSAFKVAVLGTDSAVGKRTTAWMIVDALNGADVRAELIGTGQTAWLQGATYSIMLDSLVSDFVAGEIEHAVWSAWHDTDAAVLVIEGQGSLMNPAYPGGFEILAAGRPDVIVLQHAPARTEYDGFPGYPLHPLSTQIAAIELVSGKPVVAIAVNHEQLSEAETERAVRTIEEETGRPTVAPLRGGVGPIMRALAPYLPKHTAPA